MARGLLQFVGGFAKGAMGEKVRQRDEERQKRIDDQNEQLRSLQMQTAQLNLDRATREAEDEKGLRDAGSTVAAEDGFASGESGERVFSADQGEAQSLARINADAAELEGGAPVQPKVQAASGITGGGAPRIGAAGMKVGDMNTPEGRLKRQAEYLRSRGLTGRADELETNYQVRQQQRYDAMRSGLYQKFAGTLFNDGVDAAVGLYDSYNDGFTAKVERSGEGGVVRRFDKEGKEMGQISFKNPEDLAYQVEGMLFPEKRMAERRAAANETVSVKPGEQIYRGGKLLYANDNPTSGEAAWLRALNGGAGGGSGGSGGGSGSGSKGKTPATPEDQAAELVASASKDADTAMRLAPEALVTAQSLARNTVRINPGVDPYEAGRVALAVARDPALATPTLDADSGRIMATATTESGRRLALREVKAADLSKDQRTAIGQSVTQLVGQLKAEEPVLGPMIERAAFGGQAEQAALRGEMIKAQLTALRGSPAARGRSELDLNSAANRMVDAQLAKISGQMQAIREFGKPPAAERQDAQQGGAQRGSYVPPADSPAGRFRARQEEVRRQTEAREQQRRERSQQSAAAAAEAALQSGDIADASAVQDMPGFSLLPIEQRQAISRLVLGR